MYAKAVKYRTSLTYTLITVESDVFSLSSLSFAEDFLQLLGGGGCF